MEEGIGGLKFRKQRGRLGALANAPQFGEEREQEASTRGDRPKPTEYSKNIAWLWEGGAGIENWSCVGNSVVVVGAAQADAESLGRRGFAPTGIRAGVSACFAYHVNYATESVCEDRAKGAYPRREKRQDVVGSCGPFSEQFVAFIAVPHHRIERIRRAVQKRRCGTSQNRPKKRGDDSVGGAFCDGFEGGPADLGRIEMGGIPAHDASEFFASSAQIPGLEWMQNSARMPVEIACRDALVNHPHIETPCACGEVPV